MFVQKMRQAKTPKFNRSNSYMKEWCIRIKVSNEEEKLIKRKILDSEMKIGEYTKKKLMES